MLLTCTNCNASFDGDPSERCPKCLRRTGVREAPAQASSPRGALPAPWPDGPACPICLTGTAGEASFVIAIPSGPAQTAETAGKPLSTTSVRCRSCSACRLRVESLTRRRLVLLPLVALIVVAWGVLSLSDAPSRFLRIDKLDALLAVSILSAAVAALPLLILDRASRAIRKNIEASWLLTQLLARARLKAGGDPDRPDEWKVLAEAPHGAAVVDAPDLLRT